MPREFSDGIYPGLSDEEYNEATTPDGREFKRSTQVKRFDDMPPAKAIQPTEPSAAMIVGTCFHEMVHDGEIRHEVLPEGLTLRHKEGKEIAERAKARGVNLLSADQDAAVRRMVQEVHRVPFVAKALMGDEVEAEVSAFALDVFGVPGKAKADLFCGDTGLMIDWKTTRDAVGFDRSVAQFGYALQQVWYQEVWKQAGGPECTDFIFVAVEAEPPHLVGLYRVDRTTLEEARVRVQRAVDVIRRCDELGQYPGLPMEVQEIKAPVWWFRHTDPNKFYLGRKTG